MLFTFSLTMYNSLRKIPLPRTTPRRKPLRGFTTPLFAHITWPLTKCFISLSGETTVANSSAFLILWSPKPMMITMFRFEEPEG